MPEAPDEVTIAPDDLDLFDDEPVADRTPTPIVLSMEALAEIATAFAGVDMASMPQVPPTAPCRLPDADPNDWHPPFRSADLVGLDHPGVIDEVAAWLCEGCPVLIECRNWALSNPKQGGILGGLTHTRRLSMLREGTTRPRQETS